LPHAAARQRFQTERPTQESEAADDARIEIRDGARATLAEFEEKLAPHGFVGAQRSRLLSRGRLQSFKPTPSGDLEITLEDGRVMAGSRRFRAAVEG